MPSVFAPRLAAAAAILFCVTGLATTSAAAQPDGITHKVDKADTSWRALLWNSDAYGAGAGVGLESLMARVNGLKVSEGPARGTEVKLPTLEHLFVGSALRKGFAAETAVLLRMRSFAMSQILQGCTAETSQVPLRLGWFGVNARWRIQRASRVHAELEATALALKPKHPKAAAQLKTLLANGFVLDGEMAACKQFEIIQTRTGAALTLLYEASR